MSDIKLFKVHPNSVQELPGASVAVEKSLQTLIERHLEALLGVRFLASEHSTGKNHRGRIDTLGIDENNRPVIIEYKRALNQNVINQGLYYLNWLMDHKAELKLIVLDRMVAVVISPQPTDFNGFLKKNRLKFSGVEALSKSEINFRNNRMERKRSTNERRISTTSDGAMRIR